MENHRRAGAEKEGKARCVVRVYGVEGTSNMTGNIQKAEEYGALSEESLSPEVERSVASLLEVAQGKDGGVGCPGT